MDLRHEALLMLDKRGAVLETARTVSRLMREHHIRGAVIDGVAVVLHGHVRTTTHVDVLIQQPLESVRPVLESGGFSFDPTKREFMHEGVPLHLVPENMVTPAPKQLVEIEDVTTVSLTDLINMKLHSRVKSVARAQDLADVIGLIRRHRLTAGFTSQIHSSLRREFRKLVKAVERGG